MSHVSLAGLVAAEMGKACLGNEATGLRRDTWHSSPVFSALGLSPPSLLVPVPDWALHFNDESPLFVSCY